MTEGKKTGTLKKPKSRFHHGDLRASAIEVAIAEIEERGHGALTLQQIAKRLGVTRPALYRHFSNRRDLLQAAAQQVFARFEARLTDAVFAHEDPWAALQAVGLAYLHFAVENRGWFRLQFTSSTDERPMPDLDATPARYFDGMIGALRRVYGGEDDELQLRYLVLWGTMHGITMLAVERIFGMPDEESLPIHEATLQMFMDELRTGPPRDIT